MSRLRRITSAIAGFTAAALLLSGGVAYAEPTVPPTNPTETELEPAPPPDPDAPPQVEGNAERAAEGVPTIDLAIPDQFTGDSYPITFELVSQAQAADRNVFVYLPQGWQDPIGKIGLDPRVDPNPNDDWAPCAAWPDEYVSPLRQEGMDSMARDMADRVLPINQDFYGPIPPADPANPDSGAIVIFVYEVIGGDYYDCNQLGIAGQYDSSLSAQAGMYAFVVDATWPGGVDDMSYFSPTLAHELQHLQTDQVAPEEAWVDEGLSRMIEFLGFEMPIGSMGYAYGHRDVSLVNWEFKTTSYDASSSLMGYLWARAGGDRGVDLEASDKVYQDEAGDLLVRLIQQNPKSGIAGIEDSIRQWNEKTGGDLPADVRQLYLDLSLALALDVEGAETLFMPGFTDGLVRSRLESDGVGIHSGPWTEERWETDQSVLAQTVRQYQTNYSYFSQVGERFRLSAAVSGAEATDPDGDGLLWIAQPEANQTVILTSAGGDLGDKTLSFVSKWHFFDGEGLDGTNRGWLEALVNDEWVAIPFSTADGVPMTDPANGNLVVKLSPPDPNDPKGDLYFAPMQAQLPTGATAIRFRNENSIDYQNTSWYLDSVQVNGSPLTLAGDWKHQGEWPSQEFAVQVAATCDLTPGIDSEGERVEADYHLYRWVGMSMADQEFTSCSDEEFVVTVSGLSDRPTEGALDVSYTLRLITLDSVPTPTGEPTTRPTEPTGTPTVSESPSTQPSETVQPTQTPTPEKTQSPKPEKTKPAKPRDDLADTGSTVPLTVGVLALVAVAAGGVALVVNRRRR